MNKLTGKKNMFNDMENFYYDNNWTMAGETLWGIVQKLKYSNHIKSRTLVENLLPTNKQINNYHFQLSYNDSWQINSYLNSIMFNEKSYSEEEISRLTKSYHDEKMRSYQLSNMHLNYCPICMQSGYHSFAHQLKLLDYCYLHPNIRLRDDCPRCKRKLSYGIDTLSENLICGCGHSFLKNESPIKNFRNWSQFNPKRFEEIIKIEKRSSNDLWYFADFDDCSAFSQEDFFLLNQVANRGELFIRETKIHTYTSSGADLDFYVFGNSKYDDNDRERINRYAKNKKLLDIEFQEYIYEHSRVIFKYFSLLF